MTRSHEALHLARELGHPFSLVFALLFAACWLHLERRDRQIAQERADAVVALSSEHGFPYHLAVGAIQRGAALIALEQWEEGIAQVRQGLEAVQAMGVGLWWSYYLVLLAETYGKVGQPEEGLSVLAEALAFVDKTGEWLYEAELYRIKGELSLQSKAESYTLQVEGAEACFLKAIEIAQKQQAKSLELRAVMSLARLWQSQGKQKEARQMLPRSTTGSPKGLTPRICTRRRRC